MTPPFPGHAHVCIQVYRYTGRNVHVAWRLGLMLREWAAEGALPIVIDIGLFHRRLFFGALTG